MHVRRSQAHSLSGHGVRQATTNISGSLLAPARNDDVCSQHSQSLGRLVSDSSVASRYNGHSTALVDLRVRQTSTHSHRSHTQHSSNPFTQSHTHTPFIASSQLPFMFLAVDYRCDVQVVYHVTVNEAKIPCIQYLLRILLHVYMLTKSLFIVIYTGIRYLDISPASAYPWPVNDILI